MSQASADFQVVTHNYLWMKHPTALAQIAAQVKAGKADRAHLDQLVGHSFAETLLGSNLASLPSGAKRGDLAAVLPDKAEFIRRLALPIVLKPTDYFPGKINCDKMVPDIPQASSVYVTSPIEGTITASIDEPASEKAKASFYINQMETLTGVVKNGADVVDQVSKDNVNLPTKAGQVSIMSLVFVSYTGSFSADLHLSCTGPAGKWSVVVPIKIVCAKNNDQTVQLVGYNPHVSAFRGQPFNVTFKVKPVNFRKPFFCFVTSPKTGGLAPTSDPAKNQFYVKDDKEMTVTIPCTCSDTAPDADYVDFTQMIRADNGMTSVVYTNVTVAPYQRAYYSGDLTSIYDAPIYVPFGDPGSFSQTWMNPEVVIDGTGRFAFLGQESDDKGHIWNLNPNWPVAIGVYFIEWSQNLGYQNFGSYDQLTGKSAWIRDNWQAIYTGTDRIVFYNADATEWKYFNGSLPPMNVKGQFTWPWPTPVTIRQW